MSLHHKNFFTAEEEEDILLAIQSAELDTSAEIRVHIDERCQGDARDCARDVFHRLNMFDTRFRNGVLIYLSIANRKFAIYTDKAVRDTFSKEDLEVHQMILLDAIREDRITDGLIQTIESLTKMLKDSFPYDREDQNELSNEISYGETVY